MLKFISTILASFLFTAFSLQNQYHIDSLTPTIQSGFSGTFATANYQGTDKYYIKPRSTIAQTLNITVLQESDQEFTVYVLNAEKPPRFSMPYEFPFSYTKTKPEDVVDPDYDIQILREPFSFNVKRKATEEVIFDTSSFDFIHSEFYLTFGTKLPSRYLYGLGERRAKFLYESGTYTIWDRDNYGTLDTGKGGMQTYGAHPVYLVKEKSGNWNIVFLRTTNALDFIFSSQDETLKFIVTGGHIELKFFLGDEYPDTAIKLYHNYINRWALMPFWSHGYHQCRWGYLYLNDIVTVVDKMQENDLPIDVIWSDIDYMKNFIDFTIDEERFPLEGLLALTKRLHWIPIIDSGVYLDYEIPAYQKGSEYNVWIRSARNHSNYLVGVVWPGVVHWPDWLNPNASKYWSEMFSELYKMAPFSGIWIDMDENANFCLGEYPKDCSYMTNYLPNFKPPASANSVVGNELTPAEIDPITDTYEFIDLASEEIPYVPGNLPLERMTLSLNALHYEKVLNFDFHNLDPFYEAFYTNRAIVNLTGERPFVLTRGSFVGSGQFAAHWTGDNLGTWEHLRISISEMFEFQLFGMTMIGADICGFGLNAQEEICARWMQLGAFYPFMRNHNAYGNIPQEPYALGQTVLEASRASLHLRYSILKFYYSLFVRNNGVGTVFRPLFFDFPGDDVLLDLETQFLIGSEIMVAAVVEPGKTQANVYFPSGTRWYGFFDGKLIADKQEGPTEKLIDAPLNNVLPVFIRGGSIVHRQDTKGIKKSEDLTNVFNLVVALTPVSKDNSVAFGQMMGITNYHDDLSVDKCIGNSDCMINIAVDAVTDSQGRIKVTVNYSANTSKSVLEDIKVGEIAFYGVRNQICGAEDSYCNWGDLVIKCQHESPKPVVFGTVTYALDKDGCKVTN